jgi:transposase
VKFFDAEKGRSFVFLTNQFMLPAHTIAELYRYRWRVEIFFKWIKQHLRIKSFYGTSQNAVKTQIWIAISTYVLVAIMKKRLRIDLPLYTILQILSITLFEKMPIYRPYRPSRTLLMATVIQKTKYTMHPWAYAIEII